MPLCCRDFDKAAQDKFKCAIAEVPTLLALLVQSTTAVQILTCACVPNIYIYVSRLLVSAETTRSILLALLGSSLAGTKVQTLTCVCVSRLLASAEVTRWKARKALAWGRCAKMSKSPRWTAMNVKVLDVYF